MNYQNATSVQENGLFVSLNNSVALRIKWEVVVPDNPVIVSNGLKETTATERRQGIPSRLSNGSPCRASSGTVVSRFHRYDDTAVMSSWYCV